MAFIEVDWFPHPRLVAAGFYSLANDLKPQSLSEPIKRSIQEVIAPAFQQNFSIGGNPPWEEWDEDTVKHNQTGRSILVKSGKLRRVAGQLNLWTIDGMRAEAYADQAENRGVGYGIVHQVGSDNIPARPWATMDAKDLDKVEQVFGRWLDERIAIKLKTKAM